MKNSIHLFLVTVFIMFLCWSCSIQAKQQHNNPIDSIVPTIDDYSIALADTTFTWDQSDSAIQMLRNMLGDTLFIDTDKDGITDIFDSCPNEIGPIENRGCPLDYDTDKDGIRNDKDKCPNEHGDCVDGCKYSKIPDQDDDRDGTKNSEDAAPCEWGPKCNNGIPNNDRDCDGIIDSKDKCPEQKGTAKKGGCALDPNADDDGDGVKNKDDKAPFKAGPICNNGLPNNDNDCDGIIDSEDKCPDIAGTKSDCDGDGIPDYRDRCYNIASSCKCGCPEGCLPDGDVDKDGLNNASDSCPCFPCESKHCPDADCDNVHDKYDKYPFDPERW